MSGPGFNLTGYLARAARALVETSATTTGQYANLTRAQVRDFERGHIDLTDGQKTALIHALEQLGAVFIADGEQPGAGDGAGVRLKFTTEKVRRIETWEDEGGPAYDDDV